MADPIAPPLPAASALHGFVIGGAFGKEGDRPLTLSERRGLALVQLATSPGRADILGAALAARLGLAGAPGPGRSASRDGATLLRIGPGRWLLQGENADGATLETEFTGMRAGCFATDLTHARAAIRVEGPATRDLLSRGCAIDLHPTAFPVGACAVTGMVETSVLLHCVAETDGATTADLFVPRTMAASFWEWLTGRAAVFGYTVAEH